MGLTTQSSKNSLKQPKQILLQISQKCITKECETAGLYL